MDSKWLINKLSNGEPQPLETRPVFPLELSLSGMCSPCLVVISFFKGPKYPFKPHDLFNLQRRTDTLTGREFMRRIEVPKTGNNDENQGKSRRLTYRIRRQQLREYQWKVADDDDDMQEDLLAPKYASF